MDGVTVHVLYLRHAESLANYYLDHLLTDPTAWWYITQQRDSILSDTGIQQAQALHHRIMLSESPWKHPDLVISSCLRRAMSTAHLLYPQHPIFLAPFLRESGYDLMNEPYTLRKQQEYFKSQPIYTALQSIPLPHTIHTTNAHAEHTGMGLFQTTMHHTTPSIVDMETMQAGVYTPEAQESNLHHFETYLKHYLRARLQKKGTLPHPTTPRVIRVVVVCHGLLLHAYYPIGSSIRPNLYPSIVQLTL